MVARRVSKRPGVGLLKSWSRLFGVLIFWVIGGLLACGGEGPSGVDSEIRFDPPRGESVQVRGGIQSDGRGDLLLQVLRLPENGPPELLHSQPLEEGQNFEFAAPRNLGAVSIVVFLDRSSDGPTADDKGGRVDASILSEAVEVGILRVGELSALGTLMPGFKHGADPDPEDQPDDRMRDYTAEAKGGMPGWWLALWPFLLLPLLWCLPASGLGSRRWRTQVDWPIAVLLGIGMAWAHSVVLADHFLDAGRFFGSDFSRYCGSLGAMVSGNIDQWHPASSKLPGFLTAPLVPGLGVVDAMTWVAMAAGAVTACATYLWASALHSRTAGVAAALFTATLMPLVVLTRTLSFYPLQVGINALCLALSVAALSRPTRTRLVMGSVAVSVVLLMDVRGVLVAMPCILLLGLAVFRSRKSNRIGPLVGLVALPIWCSWMVAPAVYAPDSSSLEDQVMALNVNRDAVQNRTPGIHFPKTDFRWGQSNPLAFPASLVELSKNSASLKPYTRDLAKNQEGRTDHVFPWFWPVLISLAVVVWNLRRMPWRLLALGVGLIPALTNLHTVIYIEFHLRFLAMAAPAVAVLLGVAFACLLGHRGEEERDAFRVQSPLSRLPAGSREVVAFGILGVALFGAIPSWMSPNSARGRAVPVGQIGQALEWAASVDWTEDPPALWKNLEEFSKRTGESHTQEWEACDVELRREMEEGISLGGRLFP